MDSLTYTNAPQAYFGLYRYVMDHGIDEDSRNGPVLYVPYPVGISYLHPWQRVVTDPVRNANPFFHFMEFLWMMAGRYDVEWISNYNSRMKEYSDDGVWFHGAYGYRWRFHYIIDQIDTVIHMLEENPLTRRAVISMWDPREDLNSDSKDLPCNNLIYFQSRESGNLRQLDMMVVNRSNDLIWGCLGSNVVHFSMLHQFMADALRFDLGTYTHVTMNLHIYKEVMEKYPEPERAEDIYRFDAMRPGIGQIVHHRDTWFRDLILFMNTEYNKLDQISQNPFFRNVAVPMAHSWAHYKNDELDMAIKMCGAIKQNDWRIACHDFLSRIQKNRSSKKVV